MRLFPNNAISYRKRTCPECGGKLRSVKFNFQKPGQNNRYPDAYRIVHVPGRVCDNCEGQWLWVERLKHLGIFDQVINEVVDSR